MKALYLSIVISMTVTSSSGIELFGFVGYFTNLIPLKNPFTPSTMADLILPFGYPLEQHEIETEDGYLLTVYRIPYGRNKTEQPRPALFLQHGIMCSSACWVLNEPEKGLGFLLADAGYDVWMGNSRGTTYSRKHKTLDPDLDKAKFWDFSFHEMGYYDLPATIDFIRNSTDQSQVYYVGHSQGTTMFFAMAATRPEYNAKVKVMSALAPVAFLQHTRGAIKILAKFSAFFSKIISWFGMHEILSNSYLLHFIDRTICRKSAITRPLCDNLLFAIAGFDSQQLNISLVPAIVDHCPTGASSKQLLHFAQLTKNGEKFSMYDYGTENIKKYGMDHAPEYNLSKITVPVMLHYASNDWLAGPEDVEILYQKLPNARTFEVPFAYFNHLDFMWAIDAKSLLYDNVIKIMKEYK